MESLISFASGWLSLPVHKMGTLSRIPSGVLSGSDQLLAFFLQVIVNLLSSPSPQRVRWMFTVLTHLVQGLGALPGLGGSRPQETQALTLASHVSLVCLSLPFCTMGAVLFRVTFSTSQIRGF